jgi:V/A-type H+-transporting ATPase subunit I
MASTSIICTKKDVESMLETLNTFGEFHIEPSAQEGASLAGYSQSIQRVEERLLDVNGLIKELVHEKGSLFGIFKTTQPVKVQVTADNWQALLEETSNEILTLKEEIERLDASLSGLKENDDQLKHLKKMLSNMECVGADLLVIEKLKLISVTFASVPFKNFEPFLTAIADLPLYVNQCHLSQEEYFACLIAPIKHKDEVERILRTYHAEIFHMPPDLPQNIHDAGKEVDNCLKENHAKEKEVSAKIQDIGEENKDKLASWKESTENILALLNAEKKILQSGRLATVKGFVPQSKFQELTRTVNANMEGKALILENEPASEGDPPTKFKHGRFVKPFEEITKLYGLPKYDEVDPTPLMAITFPIIFGLMFGDIGHGLVLLVGGLTVGLLIKGNQSLKNVCWIMAACGIGAIAAGAVFGEFFGQEINQVFGQEIYTPLFSPFQNPQVNILTFLIFALFVGIVQITSGIVLEMANFAVKRNYVDALLTSAPKIGFYLGGVWLVATYQLNFGAWMAGPIPPILAPVIPFIILVAGKPLYLTIAKPQVKHLSEHAEQDTLTGRLFEGGDFFTRLLSNTISYSRILALLMAHWALLLVTYTVAGLVAPEGSGAIGLILAGIIIVFGNIAVLGLEGLVVFIHTLRLHFYEWFSKFYAGTGIEFSPFKQRFSHTILNLKRRKVS